MNPDDQHTSRDPDELVTLLTATSEFAANAIVVVLADAGIDAMVFRGWTGIYGFNSPPTPVQVRRVHLWEG